MTSLHDRLKMKRASTYETWSTREQLCLASSVLKSGDQNWISVSRSLKPFIEKEALRPPDWFSQKSCAVQYAHLLENADTPKRKKRESGETTSESIVRRLTQERIAELGQILEMQRMEYKKLKAELNLLKSSSITEEKLQKMWLAIEQEEKEQEQKIRAHNAWLAKRHQKQEVSSPQSLSMGSQRKSMEVTPEPQESAESVTEEEERKNKGGRSPLLTSLLKSPSPTTQIQSSTSPAQVNSPTIASLLGSSPKVPGTTPQLAQNVSPQLHQLVSTALANATVNATPERPSTGAPTLSMLLEMPANAQRGPLPNLQTPPTVVQQNIPMEVYVPPQSAVSRVTIQNEVPATRIPIITTPTSIPVTESMVQIIDHIDDVIRKDIMADVMDKDEINEIIGDIEELIKEEITGSPQTLETTVSTPVINTIPLPVPSQPEEVEVPVAPPNMIPERPAPRDVDEPVSLSNSPESEMAIEEIDSSTSNIAEIIGTVAIEPSEPKPAVVVPKIPETDTTNAEEENSETNVVNEKTITNEEIVSEPVDEDTNDIKTVSIKEETVAGDVKTANPEIVESEAPDTKATDAKESVTDAVEDETEEQNSSEALTSEKENSCEIKKEQKESSEGSENKSTTDVDQLEMHLAKITGEQQNAASSEAVSVSSELTNDVPSAEDTEKSQDISLILEDDESTSQSCDEKKKVKEEQMAENTVDSTESLESFKDDTVVTVKKKDTVETEASSVKSQGELAEEETLEIYTDDFKKEDTKDSSEDTTSSILQDIEIKEEEVEDSTVAEDTNELTTPEETEIAKEPTETVKSENDETDVKSAAQTIVVPKSEEVATEEISKDETEPVTAKEEPPVEPQVKEEKEDTKKGATTQQVTKKETVESTGSTGDDTGELDEEESSLTKLSGGRAMKTYSKKQNVTVDSEPENETSEGADYRAWKKAVMLVYNRLATHKYASVFLRPITEDQAPGYHSVVFRPMDLLTIKKNVENGTIRSTMHFQRDVMLMFQNAIMYNKHDTFVYKMAVSMQEECLQHMQILVQVTGEGTFRRETRTAASSSVEITDNIIKRKRSLITPSPHDTESPRSKKRRKSEND